MSAEEFSPDKDVDGVGANSNREFYRSLEAPGSDADAPILSETSPAVRAPVVEHHGDLPDAKAVARQWGLITEAVRREMLQRPEVRDALIQFAAAPLSQALPGQMLAATAEVDPLVAKLAERYDDGIGAFTGLPGVPEAVIGERIRDTPGLNTPESDQQLFAHRYEDDPAGLQAFIQKLGQDGRYAEGITPAEKWLAVERYVEAREVKLLALGAELTESPVTLDAQGQAELPSGIKLVANPDASEAGLDLLDPSKWQGRKQLKGRVYEITVGERAYILKEQRTGRHFDPVHDDYKGGPKLTAAQEYEAGKRLHDSAAIRRGDITLTWECPLGYVEFPDGYSFNVYEKNEAISHPDKRADLVAVILSSPEEFADEFADVTKLISRYANHPLVTWIGKGSSRRSPSFEEFARQKAANIFEDALELHAGMLSENGLVLGDNASENTVIHLPDPTKPQVEIIGFDYETLRPLTEQEAEEQKQNVEQSNKTDPNLLFFPVDETSPESRALHLAMLDHEGKMPEAIAALTPPPWKRLLGRLKKPSQIFRN